MQIMRTNFSYYSHICSYHSHYVFRALARLALNFSTLPAVSISFFLPVKKGWQALQISTSIFSFVEPVVILFPQAHLIIAPEKYFG